MLIAEADALPAAVQSYIGAAASEDAWQRVLAFIEAHASARV